jgi:chaperonin GroEL
MRQSKKILRGDEIRAKIKRGVDEVADTVKLTLGPRGRNVILEKHGDPLITNDGVTIAKEIVLEDSYENLGASLIKQVASKADKTAGDGTTTASVLAQAMVNEGLKLINTGYNPVFIKNGMYKARDFLLKEIEEMAVEIKEKEEVAAIAEISSNSSEIGKLIAEAFAKIGKDGNILIEPGKGYKDELEFVEGMRYDKGYVSNTMITESKTRNAELFDPFILFTDYKIDKLEEITPLLEDVMHSDGAQLVIVCSGISANALQALVMNRVRNGLDVFVTEAEGFGDRKKEMLEDMAIATGGFFISETTGTNLNQVTIEETGRAKKVIIEKDHTTIIGRSGEEEKIEDRRETIRKEIEETKSQYEREELEKRLGRLTNGVATLNLGANSDSEMFEKKLRVEDAVNAAKGALQEGVVPGGGICLLRVKQELEASKTLFELAETEDETLGMKVVLKALEAPIRQIVINAGDAPDVVINDIAKSESKTTGYNAKLRKIGEMYEEGVIDPAKVVKSSLQNAISVAGVLLTTESAIVNSQNEMEMFKRMFGNGY